MIEAVTGSGKTDVAITAIDDALTRGLFALVIVPSRVLMEQWHERLTESLPARTVGRLGDGYRDRPADCDVLITTRLAAASRVPRPPGDLGGLLVADECHGFGGAVLRKSLLPEYQERLGLTATLERSDDAVESILLPYFGGICYRYDFGAAIADGVCAQPGWRSSPCPSRQRRSEYDATERAIVTARHLLKQIPGVPHPVRRLPRRGAPPGGARRRTERPGRERLPRGLLGDGRSSRRARPSTSHSARSPR
ncbi:MAG: DEAD/DEAH box helicase family protein [Acidimicrobiales bacterium]